MPAYQVTLALPIIQVVIANTPEEAEKIARDNASWDNFCSPDDFKVKEISETTSQLA